MTIQRADYDELEVRIDRLSEDDDSYNVRVIGPDGGSKRGTFTPPFDNVRLENFVLKVGRARGPRRGGPATDQDEAKRVGRQLFDSLFTGDVYKVYRSAFDRARDRERGLRVTLYLTDAPALLHYPWEFLYERPRFLARSVETPVVRSLDLETVRRPRQLALPIQILGIDSRPTGRVPLDADAERANLERALAPLQDAGLVRLRWLKRATLRELQQTLDAPDDVHVVHYIGHGEFDERSGTGMLVLERPDRSPHLVTGEDLGGLMYDESSLRLVVLNACEGARASHLDPFSGVASGLVACDIPAVVGMQFEITDDAAVTFAQQLYHSLAQGWPVDAAATQARRAIWSAGMGTEWGTPVLFLRSGDARLFDVEDAPAAPVDELPGPPAIEPTPANGEPLEQSPPQQVARPAARAALEVVLERVSSPGQPPETATWELAITNASDRPLREVVVTQADGSTIGEVDRLEPGSLHTVRWTDPQAAEASRTVQVSATGPDGDWVREEVVAEGNRRLFDRRVGELEGTLYTNQRQELRKRITESETLLGMCRCSRPNDATRAVVMLITTEQLTWVREALWSSVSGLTFTWNEVASVVEVPSTPKTLEIRTLDGSTSQFSDIRGTGVSLAGDPMDFSFEGLRDRFSSLAGASPSPSTDPVALVRSFTHDKQVSAVSFSADGTRLAIGSGKTARVVAVSGGAEVVAVKHGGILEQVHDVALSRDGRRLATGCGDRTARIWELPAGSELVKLDHPNWVRAVAFAPDGRTLATGCDDDVARIWELPSGRVRHRLRHGGDIHSIAYDSSGRRLATGSGDKRARVWDAGSGSELTVVEHGKTVRGVALSPDGTLLLVGSDDKTARLWTLPDGRERLKLEHAKWVRAVAFAPDGQRFATACEDKVVRIWDLDGQLLAHLPHDNWALSIAFSPDGTLVATGSRDKSVRLWELGPTHSEHE